MEKTDFYGRLLPVSQGEQALTGEERLLLAKNALLFWYREKKRQLPWRETADGYHIWISEIMLQQTRVEAVKPYYARFMEHFPTVWALAGASDEELLKCWEGLGYYSRARNLKKAAAVIAEQYGGCLPSSYEELLKLPGIGSYTAGAIGSIAYGLPVPAVDGNVLRVLSRVTASREDILKQQTRRKMEALVSGVLKKMVLQESEAKAGSAEEESDFAEREENFAEESEKPKEGLGYSAGAQAGSGAVQESFAGVQRGSEKEPGKPEKAQGSLAGDFNQALIEIGAMVCVPNGAPLCVQCAFRTVCLAAIHGLTGEIPVRSPKKKRKIEEKTVLLLEYEDKIAIRKRREGGLLASLYEFPNLSGVLKEQQVEDLFSGNIRSLHELPGAKHVFSHTEWHMNGYFLSLKEPESACLETGDSGEEPLLFVEWKELTERYPLPGAFSAYRKILENYLSSRHQVSLEE